MHPPADGGEPTMSKLFRRANSGFRAVRYALALAACVVFSADSANSDDELPVLEQRAIQEAVDAVAPFVVRLEVFGDSGAEGLSYDRGPTSGLLLGDEGYLITSQFGIGDEGTNIVAVMPDGTRKSATRVATDYSRELVLLRVDGVDLQGAPVAAPKDELGVGQWAIALGRTLGTDHPNVSVGIVSALNRVWGKTVQTDAKVSPNNYGGPLVDIHGRVIGILTPMAHESAAEVAGVEWYDSGIGFAVPLEDVFAALPRLRTGTDLKSGVMGVYLESNDLYAPPLVSGARPGSPAYLAGLKAGDRIVSINGRPIANYAGMRFVLGPLYGGDTIQIEYLRGEERLSAEMRLVAEMPPVARAYLGILTERTAASEKQADDDSSNGDGSENEEQEREKQAGVLVWHVFAGSPAELAGMQAGDRVTSIDGNPIENRRELRKALASHLAGEKIAVRLLRGDGEISLDAVLTEFPNDVPGQIPTRTAAGELPAERPPLGVIEQDNPLLPEQKVLLYVPENYDPRAAYGVIVHIHAPGEYDKDAIAARWKSYCDERGWLLFAPVLGDKDRWQPRDLDWIRQRLGLVGAMYSIDADRIVAHGEAGGGSLAYLWGFDNRARLSGVSVVDAAIPIGVEIPDGESIASVQFFITSHADGTEAERIAEDARILKEKMFPVVERNPPGRVGPLEDAPFGELQRWMDAVDRL
jgi:serine protease Do